MCIICDMSEKLTAPEFLNELPELIDKFNNSMPDFVRFSSQKMSTVDWLSLFLNWNKIRIIKKILTENKLTESELDVVEKLIDNLPGIPTRTH